MVWSSQFKYLYIGKRSSKNESTWLGGDVVDKSCTINRNYKKLRNIYINSQVRKLLEACPGGPFSYLCAEEQREI